MAASVASRAPWRRRFLDFLTCGGACGCFVGDIAWSSEVGPSPSTWDVWGSSMGRCGRPMGTECLQLSCKV